MRFFHASAVAYVHVRGRDGSHRTCLIHEMWAEMQPAPHLMPKEAATRDARVGKWEDTLRREGHSEDIAAPEAAPAEHKQAVVRALHLAGQWAASPWAAPMDHHPREQCNGKNGQ